MTWLDDIPLEQKEVVDELRKRTINDCTPKMLEDPVLFYRFSKGCNFNIKNAESMLRNHILWRKENRIDTILTEFKCPEVIQNYFPLSRIGYDKDGCPVNYIGVGNLDEIGIIKSCTATDFLKFVCYIFEEDRAMLHEQSQKTGKLITQFTYIYNCDGLTFLKVTNKIVIQVVMQIASSFQNNYPESTKAIYVINASKYFTLFFSFVKLIITSGLISKIRIFGTDDWKEKLLEIVDDEVLPAFLGGKRTDPDGNPLCKSFMCHGGKVPEKYYLSPNKSTLKDQDGVKKIIAGRRSSTDIVIDIVDPYSVLMWEVEIRNRDVRFGINYVNPDQNDEKIVELIPTKTIDTSNGPERGTYVCKNAGKYILVFDNSYSWIYSKEIYYRTNVILQSTD